MNALRPGLLVALSLAGLFHSLAFDRADAQGSCRDSDLVVLYPGYPGFRGYLPDTVGGQDWVCPEDLPTRFDPSDEDRDNERAADHLGIRGSIEDWTWGNWMAIEAERGLHPTCFSCAILNPPSFALYEPAQRIDREEDARYVLGTFETTNIAFGWFAKNDFPVGNVRNTLTDYEIRAIAMMAYEDEYLNANQVVRFGEEFLECQHSPAGTEGCGGRVDVHGLCRSMVRQHGYAPTPDDAASEDQAFTVIVGFWALQRYMPQGTANAINAMVERSLTDWQVEQSRDISTPGFGEWLEDNGGADMCPG